jgi:hypothetical protein
MGIVAWAAQDPIFWCHHANVDRLWVEWVNRHPNSLPNDSAWLDQTFTFFDVNGQPVSIAASRVLTTTGLGYQYEPAATALAARHEMAAMPDERAAHPDQARTMPPRGERPQRYRVETAPTQPVLGPRPVSVTLTPPPPAHEHLARIIEAHRRNAPHGAVQLSIEGMQVPERPQILVRVFLNKPDANENTSFKDIHYAGNFSFFTAGRGNAPMHQGPVTQLLDVTRAISKLTAANQYKPGGPVTVTLVARPIAQGRGGAAVTIPFTKVALTVVP